MAALTNINLVEPALAAYLARTLCEEIPMVTRNTEGQIEIIWSSIGTPQGSVPGTLVYSAAVMKVYNTLKEEFPSFFLSSATDDLFSFFKPAVNTDESWQELYILFAKFLNRYDGMNALSDRIPPKVPLFCQPLPLFPPTKFCAFFLKGLNSIMFHHVFCLMPLF